MKLEDHINVPIFPIGLSPDSYDKYFDDYISEIAMNQFPQNKPLWEIHIVKYPTSNATSTTIFTMLLAMVTLSWVHFFLVCKELIILLFP